jgi:hypothetical protein
MIPLGLSSSCPPCVDFFVHVLPLLRLSVVKRKLERLLSEAELFLFDSRPLLSTILALP